MSAVVGLGLVIALVANQPKPLEYRELLEVVTSIAGGDNSRLDQVAQLKRYQRRDFRRACDDVIRSRVWESGKAWALRQIKETGGLDEASIDVVLGLYEMSGHVSVWHETMGAIEQSDTRDWSKANQDRVRDFIRAQVNDPDLTVQKLAIRCAERNGIKYVLTDESRRRLQESSNAIVNMHD